MFFYKLITMLLGLRQGANQQILNHGKIISISPAGYKIFYELGICKYIKENYNLCDYSFTGASAGSFVGLVFCCKKDFSEIQRKVLDNSIMETKSIRELANRVKGKILTSFTADDFELNKLHIGTTTVGNFKIKTNIYSDFIDLEDAVDCCLASSHIPLITGGIASVYYRNVLTFDGGFSKYPYLLTPEDSVLHITPEMWNKDEIKSSSKFFRSIDCSTLFSRERYNFNNMIDDGYKDSLRNKDYLDKIFKSKNDP